MVTNQFSIIVFEPKSIRKCFEFLWAKQWCIVLVSIAAVTSYHTFRGLTKANLYFTVLQVRNPLWVSLESNKGIDRTVFFLQDPGENRFPCVLQLFEAAQFLGSCPPFSIFKTSNIASLLVTLPWLCLSLTDSSFLLPFPTFKDLVITWDHPDNSG